MCNSVGFRIFTNFGSYHCSVISKHFHHPKEKPILLSIHSFFLSPTTLAQTNLLLFFVFPMDLPVLVMSYKWYLIIFDQLWLASFTQHAFSRSLILKYVSELHSFYCQMKFYCIDMLYILFIHLLVGRDLSHFSFCLLSKCCC